MHAILAEAQTKYFWLPRQASTVAGGIDDLFNVILWICVFFFLLVTVLLVAFVIIYRHKPGVKRDVAATHSMTLEITWTVIPSIIVVFLYYYGFKQYMNLAVEPPNAYTVNVTGRMWQWSFDYPEGYQDGELHVPVNVPVRCILQSDDVIHSLSIPAFRVKKDVVPGRYNRLWFQATEPGTYEIYCTDYCGTNHSTMHSRVIVHPSQADFDAWLKHAIDVSLTGTPAEKGQRLYLKLGCVQCHSVDGKPVTGPTWKDLYGSTTHFTDGSTAVVNEEFLHGFLPAPTARVPVGFPPVMPPFPIATEQMDNIAAYMKTISRFAPPPTSTGGAGVGTTKPSTQPASAPAAPVAAAP
jgi:cytochrome c oxidase subunit 2